VVAGGVAHLVEVVVLAAGADAPLRGGGAFVSALVGAQEHVLELDHAGVGEQQRRVVGRHQRARGHDLVSLAGKKIQKVLADFRGGFDCRGCRAGRRHDSGPMTSKFSKYNVRAEFT
jgi:hypothetical protein